ncbi:GntR family transcriptional regulator [Sphingomonas sp. T9W2]|uniref:GntR family transcriptional regulator n=1 Tax=Sphingomonas sp. T9W2 TaxID=3143183 RepID=UPI0031F547B4
MRELTLSTRIALEIADQIVEGRRAPGSHLNEQALAEEFGVSRTPIREAIRHLVAMEHVQILPRRGTFVNRIPVKRLLQIFEFIAEIEAVSARLAARRMTVEEKQALQQLHASCKEAIGTEQGLRHMYQFHRSILVGSKNEVLETTVHQLYDRLTPYRRRQVMQIGREVVSIAEHEDVLSAIMAGDGEAAELAMRRHAASVQNSMMDMIALLPDD